MERSDSVIDFTKALSKFQGTMRSVPKGSTNPFFHAKYADLDAVWDMCRKPLSENGLALVQTTVIVEGKMYLDTVLLHSSGEWMSGRYPITPMRQVQNQGWMASEDPQSIGSAITYARRYAMSAMLGISADEDDDAQAATGKGPKKQTPAAGGAAQAAAGKSSSSDDLLCPEHKVAYSRHEKNGKVWYSHKTPDGKWCNREDVQKAQAEKDKDDLFGPEQPAPATPQVTTVQEPPALKTLGDLYTAGRHLGYQTKKDMLAAIGVSDDTLIGDLGEAFQKLQEHRP